MSSINNKIIIFIILIVVYKNYDKIPSKIDHINRNPEDNRPSNLRFATHTEQAKNRKTPIRPKIEIKIRKKDKPNFEKNVNKLSLVNLAKCRNSLFCLI